MVALTTNSWAAESTDPSAQAAVKPTPGQLDNGLISLTKLVPTITRVSTGTQDFANNPLGLGLFYRFGYVPDNRNVYNMTMSGGLGARGIIPGRPNDRMGFGAYAMFASDDFQEKSLLLNELLDDEFGLEAYYNFAITPWAQISADVQWIDQGITTSDSAWVVGSRLTLRF